LRPRFVLDADGGDAGHAAERLRAEERRHALAKFRIVHEIEMRLGRKLTAEAGEPVLDVGGIADLAGLAVADDVEADLGLAPDDVTHGPGDDAREFRLIVRLAAVLAQQQRDRVVRPRQAADVGGENAVPTCLHDVLK
jgi:hypothetical protein